MDKIHLHKSALFTEASVYSFIRFIFLSSALAGLMYSVYSPISDLYVLSLVALGFQVTAWLLGKKVEQVRYIAHELHKIMMLENAYKSVPNDFELSHLIARISLFSKFCSNIKIALIDIYKNTLGKLFSFIFGEKKETEEYHIRNDIGPREVLLSMIHENSYWNHNQYKFMFIIGGMLILIILIASVFSLLYIIPKINNGMDYSILRVVFIFLSFTIIYDLMDKIIQYYQSSKIMLEIDNEIQRNHKHSEINALDIFDKYIKTIEKTPSIPYIVYKLNRSKLNEGWRVRSKIDRLT